ncbi:hypothetical protein HOLDEFILI_02499 [Holdemania filiformis DSM 12042]|uniref:Uncharacterized protein n=1 Tax=Holdemania filiformis DSM 12042 TaxID=545696 RepID=B9Y9J3_9FIRM|nr:hypothetical protein HOLDEFILI_02499 [Holdemania filiformis DSM 12042]
MAKGECGYLLLYLLKVRLPLSLRIYQIKKQTMFLGRKRSVPTVSAWSDPKEHREGILSVFLIHHFPHRGKKEKLITTLFLFRILERFMG